MNDTDKLRQVIRDQHGLTCTHVRSEPVRETFNGETVWDGVVEVFTADDGAIVYAWSHETDSGGRRYVAVLGRPPISSARDAVRAAIAAEHRGVR